jgi:hypothetical protein
MAYRRIPSRKLAIVAGALAALVVGYGWMNQGSNEEAIREVAVFVSVEEIPAGLALTEAFDRKWIQESSKKSEMVPPDRIRVLSTNLFEDWIGDGVATSVIPPGTVLTYGQFGLTNPYE